MANAVIATFLAAIVSAVYATSAKPAEPLKQRPPYPPVSLGKGVVGVSRGTGVRIGRAEIAAFERAHRRGDSLPPRMRMFLATTIGQRAAAKLELSHTRREAFETTVGDVDIHLTPLAGYVCFVVSIEKSPWSAGCDGRWDGGGVTVHVLQYRSTWIIFGIKARYVSDVSTHVGARAEPTPQQSSTFMTLDFWPRHRLALKFRSHKAPRTLWLPPLL